MKRKYRISKRKATMVNGDTKQFTRFITFYRAQQNHFGFWIGITPETEERWQVRNAIKELIKEDKSKLVAKPKGGIRMERVLETLMNVTNITVGRMDSIVKFDGVEVTKEFVEFVFKNCNESKAIELANFITNKKKEESKC